LVTPKGFGKEGRKPPKVFLVTGFLEKAAKLPGPKGKEI